MSVSSEVLIWDVIFFSSIISTWLFFISFISHLIMSMFHFKSLSIFIIDILMSLLLPLSLSFLIPFPLTIYCSCWTLWIIYYWVSGFGCIPFIMVWILFSKQLTYLCISMILSRIVLNFQKKRFKINSIFRLICTYDSGVTLLYLLLDVQGVHRHFPVVASGNLNVSQTYMQSDNTSSYNFLAIAIFLALWYFILWLWSLKFRQRLKGIPV